MPPPLGDLQRGQPLGMRAPEQILGLAREASTAHSRGNGVGAGARSAGPSAPCCTAPTAITARRRQDDVALGVDRDDLLQLAQFAS